MIRIARFTFNLFGENTYLVWDDTCECAIIDAGCSNPEEEAKLSSYITAKGLKPVVAVCTHAHPDHTVGVGYVMGQYGIPFAINSDDSYLLEQLPMAGRKYHFTIPLLNIDIDLKQHAELRFGHSVFNVIPTPGHSCGGICLYLPEEKLLFSGDTLFRQSIGRTDLQGGNYDILIESILIRLMPIGDDVNVYPGHGEPTTIGEEAACNPFITEVYGDGFNNYNEEDEN